MTKQSSALVITKDGSEVRKLRLLTGFFVVIFGVFVALPGLAQTYNFNSIQVDGNQRIDSTAIVNYAGIARGTPVTAGQVNAAYQRVLDSGLFEEVEVQPRGNTLVIKVVEYPTINRISFEGNRRLKDENLTQLLESQSRRVLNPATAERDAARITQAYAESGRLAARVTPRVIRRSDNRADLVFEVFEGDIVEIERIGFVGNQNFSDTRLRRVLNTKQAGLLRNFFQQDTFVNDRIEFDKQVLRDFYLSRGYVDFRTLSVNAELARERDGYFVTFNIEEGQQFKFGEITASSDIDGVETALFLEALSLKPGVTYSPTVIENSISRMERLALKQGHDFLRVDPRITRNDRDLTLDVDFAITKGPKIFVERIDVEGNTTTLDKVIRHQFRIVEGDPFNPREIRESAERIRALGFFAGAEVNAREGSTPSQVIVDVDVEEQPTGSLALGGTFSTNDGLGLAVQFRESNFLGRGQSLGLSFSTSTDIRDYSFSFNEPAFLGRNLSAGFRIEYQDLDPSEARFTNSVANFEPSIGFQLGEHSSLRLRYTLARSEIEVSDANAVAGSIIDAEAARGRILKSSVGYTYRYDTRRSGLDPTRGYLFEFGQDFGGLGGDYTFVKTNARAVAEARVWHEEVTLRATLEGGALHSPNNDSRIDDRFIVTSRNIRGFEPFGVGPREIQPGVQDDALGGNYFAVARFEAEFPLGLPEELGITGGLFYDVGSLWGLDQTSANVLYDEFSLRHVIGASIFWDTPIGPLRFNFTRALQKEEFDREQTFDFTISAQF
ncbi:outer membrane protein assembly factor BamA [Shimia marina]|uniref:Outer membrane protein assembly factor BamA n=1 Tax=Shimia marina TaxID=321267 RepID=A0A0P1ERE4_9RHOB|nr:outer membrane protein assembly factor BamA [Shimia marina]CUH53087.1 Outer membrane protein Omp85 [Shimia marina]SFE43639.1 Beta-barrel assembly machine subunit BamA [Shimia marina]